MAINTAPTFSAPDGKVETSHLSGRSLIQQTDGKLVVAGYGNNYDYVLVRYHADGTIDTSFDEDGKVFADLGPHGNQSPIVIQQFDGKLVLAGSFGLTRYNLDGTLDITFGDDGQLNNDFLKSYSLIQQVDGKLIVAGERDNDFALVRYTVDGTLDTSFDGDGKLTTDFGSYDSAYSIVQQADGSLVVAGYASTTEGGRDFALARYHADGTLDASFGIGGKLTTEFGSVQGSTEEGYSLIQQADGKLVVAGLTYTVEGGWDFALVRYHSDGTLDTSFDGDGKLATNFSGNYSDSAASVIQQSDGNLVIAGSSYIDHKNKITLARYNSDGSLDASFDGDGKQISDFGIGASIVGSDVIQQFDNKIVVVGYAENSNNLALIRYNLDGSLDNTFSPPENSLQYTPIFGENGNKTVLAPQAHIFDAEMTSFGHYGGASLTLSRHNGANSQDVFGGLGTLSNLTEGSYFSVDNVTVGRVNVNSTGTLKLTFNSNATQGLVDKALQQIGYANTSDNPPASVQIDWVFSDGNTGAQGSDGALSVTGSSNVTIIPVNDAPVSYYLLQNYTALVGNPLNYALPDGAFVDRDLEALSYTVSMADGTGLPPWLSIDSTTGALSGTPDVWDKGAFTLRITARDASGATASDIFTLTVSEDINDAPTGDVTISGSVKEGHILTASHTLVDADGLGDVGYQWNADGDIIFGATGSTYILSAYDIGKTITVTAFYIDGFGTFESVTSAPTVAVTSAINIIAGDNSNNILLSTLEDDLIDGGAGNDTASYANASAAVNVSLASRTAQDTEGAGVDTLISIENLTGSRYDDILTGNAAANVLNGGLGADIMAGRNGNDTYYVNHVDDVVSESLAGGIDTVYSSLAASYTLRANVEKGVLQGAVAGGLVGNGLANTLTGNAAANKLDGGAGNDTLIGGAGKDALTGGAGNDVFDFNALAESGLTSTTRDIITDFVRGQDKIDLSTIDANTALVGNQAFTGLIGANVAFTKAGQLRLNAGVLYGNTDADAAAEFSIALTGITTLANTDFVL